MDREERPRWERPSNPNCRPASVLVRLDRILAAQQEFQQQQQQQDIQLLPNRQPAAALLQSQNPQIRQQSFRLSAFGPPQAQAQIPQTPEVYTPKTPETCTPEGFAQRFPPIPAPVSPAASAPITPHSPSATTNRNPYSWEHERNLPPGSPLLPTTALRPDNSPPESSGTQPPERLPGEPTPFPLCRISLAVDISGSTSGRILASEREFMTKIVLQLRQGNVQQNVYVLPWNHVAPSPCTINNLHTLQAYGGTDPVVLLKSQPHLAALKMSNLWFLLTDGEILSSDVNNLATTLAAKGMHGVSCVIIVFDTKRNPPSRCNISVGISPFAAVPNSALLYQDVNSRTCYVLATKGCFNSFLPEGASQPVLDESTKWEDLPTIRPDSAFRDLVVPAARELAPGELALSDDLTINFNDLFSSDLDNTQVNTLLGDQNNLQSLLLSAQSRGQSASALSWLQRQNSVSASNRSSVANDAAAQSIRTISAAIANRQSTGPEFERAVQELRQAHRENSMHRNSRVQVINQAINSLNTASGQNWSSSSLSATRRSRIPSVETLPTPQATESCRGHCGICFESDIVLTLLLKRPVSYNAATAGQNLTLTFPLSAGGSPDYDIISAFLVCENCSVYLVAAGETPFREHATSALPLVSWTKHSSQWRDALSKALDCFKPTFATLVPILFFAIIDHALRTKEWAKADGSEEGMQRNRALNWCRNTILNEVKMSGDGTKGALGEWITKIVTTPTKGELGLVWKYPIDGFVLMLEVSKEHNAPQELLTKTVWKKLIHLVTTRYVSELCQETDKRRMVSKADFAMSKVSSPGWLEEMTKRGCRLVGRRDLEILKMLSVEMSWVEDVAGAAMGEWLGWLKEVGLGRSTVEAVWEIKGRWGYPAEKVFERPEDVIGAEATVRLGGE